jgi:hypothetical protein
MIAKKKNLRNSQNKGNEKKKRWHNHPQTNFLLTKKREVYLVFFKDYLYFYILKLFSSRTNIRNRVQKYIEIIGWVTSTSAILRSQFSGRCIFLLLLRLENIRI